MVNEIDLNYPAVQVFNSRKETNRQSEAFITICIPYYKDNPCPLLNALSMLAGIEQCDLLLYDDGSNDDELENALCRALNEFPTYSKLVICSSNHGRAFARNRLTESSTTEWMLLLDADMLPGNPDFILGYIDYISRCNEVAVIVGGYSVAPEEGQHSYKLHAEMARRSCLPASKRAKDGGRYVFTSNILVHRDILNEINFDEQFAGWGWEDVDWGLRVSAKYSVVHLNHTATHCGLETAEVLLDKYKHSGANFARLVQQNPEAARNMPLYKIVKYLHLFPPLKSVFFRSASIRFMRTIALANIPIQIRVIALKTYRALNYYDYVK